MLTKNILQNLDQLSSFNIVTKIRVQNLYHTSAPKSQQNCKVTDTKTQFSRCTCSVSESISTPISNAGGVAFRFHFTEFSVIFFHPGALFSIRIVRERYFEIVHTASLGSKNKIMIHGTPQTYGSFGILSIVRNNWPKFSKNRLSLFVGWWRWRCWWQWMRQGSGSGSGQAKMDSGKKSN